LPFNTKYYIDYARRTINYYKNNIICPDETQAKKVIVTDLSIIPPRDLSKQKQPKSSPKYISKSIYNFTLSKLWNK